MYLSCKYSFSSGVYYALESRLAVVVAIDAGVVVHVSQVNRVIDTETDHNDGCHGLDNAKLPAEHLPEAGERKGVGTGIKV